MAKTKRPTIRQVETAEAILDKLLKCDLTEAEGAAIRGARQVMSGLRPDVDPSLHKPIHVNDHWNLIGCTCGFVPPPINRYIGGMPYTAWRAHLRKVGVPSTYARQEARFSDGTTALERNGFGSILGQS